MADWKYYNHALISTLPPHEVPDITQLANKDGWQNDSGRPLLARWTREHLCYLPVRDSDCENETNWWYVIKDKPFNISSLKAKRRYEVNKGIKNFNTVVINPCEHKHALYEVQVAAFSAYPQKYRPNVTFEKFAKDIETWSEFTIFGAFTKEDNKLVGYALLESQGEKCIKFSVQKTIPDYEKAGVNAALVCKILEHFEDFLTAGGYICDGERSINHETQFQNYLEKYFAGFRKSKDAW